MVTLPKKVKPVFDITSYHMKQRLKENVNQLIIDAGSAWSGYIFTDVVAK